MLWSDLRLAAMKALTKIASAICNLKDLAQYFVGITHWLPVWQLTCSVNCANAWLKILLFPPSDKSGGMVWIVTNPGGGYRQAPGQCQKSSSKQKQGGDDPIH